MMGEGAGWGEMERTSCGIGEHEDTALGLLFGDELTGAEEMGFDFIVLPDVGDAGWVWLGRVELLHLCPEGKSVCRFEVGE